MMIVLSILCIWNLKLDDTFFTIAFNKVSIILITNMQGNAPLEEQHSECGANYDNPSHLLVCCLTQTRHDIVLDGIR